MSFSTSIHNCYNPLSAKTAEFLTALESWRPRRDLNPCYRRERAMS
jgi:hypothetical protein